MTRRRYAARRSRRNGCLWAVLLGAAALVLITVIGIAMSSSTGTDPGTPAGDTTYSAPADTAVPADTSTGTGGGGGNHVNCHVSIRHPLRGSNCYVNP